MNRKRITMICALVAIAATAKADTQESGEHGEETEDQPTCGDLQDFKQHLIGSTWVYAHSKWAYSWDGWTKDGGESFRRGYSIDGSALWTGHAGDFGIHASGFPCEPS